MRQKTFLALAGFLALLISSTLAMATPVPSHTISNEKISPNGEYVIHVFQGGQWTEAGSLAFDRFFRKKVLDLGAYISDGDAIKIKLVQTGGGAAHIDDMPIINKRFYMFFEIVLILNYASHYKFSPACTSNLDGLLCALVMVKASKKQQIVFRFGLKIKLTYVDAMMDGFDIVKIGRPVGIADGNIKHLAVVFPVNR